MHVLIVEDEALVAMDLACLVEEYGYRVIGPANSLSQGLSLLASSPRVNFAFLDINLREEVSYDIAAKLKQDGVPFVFLTGYDGQHIPKQFASIPRLAKPCVSNEIESALKTYCCCD